MKIFISWSGERSRAVAEALRSWLPRVLQSVTPWMSDVDLVSGSRWSAEISAELADSRFGIICVTPENQNNPWLLFEAGALSKTISQTHVCPLLLEMSPSQISGPLAQFQANTTNRSGVERIISAVNRTMVEGRLRPEDFTQTFDVWWPRLDEELDKLPKQVNRRASRRSSDAIMDEVLQNSREQLRQVTLQVEMYVEREAKLTAMMDLLLRMASESGAVSPVQQTMEIPELIKASEELLSGFRPAQTVADYVESDRVAENVSEGGE